MRRTVDVERLLARIEAGCFDDDDFLEARMIADERQWPFPIEDDDPLVPRIAYDKPRELRRTDPAADSGEGVADSPRPEETRWDAPGRGEAASLESRVEYLERMNSLLWKVLHQLQGKAPADPEPRE